jgi:hypothetical protein
MKSSCIVGNVFSIKWLDLGTNVSRYVSTDSDI